MRSRPGSFRFLTRLVSSLGLLAALAGAQTVPSAVVGKLTGGTVGGTDLAVTQTTMEYQSLGDLEVSVQGHPLYIDDGVMIASGLRVGDPPIFQVPSARTDGLFQSINGQWVASWSATTGGEANHDGVSFGYFPYEAGWTGATVAADGTILAGNLPPGTTLVSPSPGIYDLDIPGASSGVTGILLVNGASNSMPITATTAQQGSGWRIVTMAHDQNFGSRTAAPFNFVYLSSFTPGVVLGRIDAAGNVLQIAGTTGPVTVTHTSPGIYDIQFDNFDGGYFESTCAFCTTFESVSLGGVTAPQDNLMDRKFLGSPVQSGQYVTWRFRSYDMPSPSAANLQDGGFVFAIIKANALNNAGTPITNYLDHRLDMGNRPAGGGSEVYFENHGFTPGAQYFTCLTLNKGSFPYGYWFGMDPYFSDLYAQIGTPAAPFQGVFDPSGKSSFALPVPGLVGVRMYGVTVEIAPGGGGVAKASQPFVADL